MQPLHVCKYVAQVLSMAPGFAAAVMIAAFRDPVVIVAKSELGNNFISRVLMRRLDVHLVERLDRIQGAEDARATVDILKEGRSLVVDRGNRLTMANRAQQPDPAQLWRFIPSSAKGYYHITNASLGDGKAIDSSPTAPHIANNGNCYGVILVPR